MKGIFFLPLLLIIFNSSLMGQNKQPISGPNCHIVHSAKSNNSGYFPKNFVLVSLPGATEYF